MLLSLIFEILCISTNAHLEAVLETVCCTLRCVSLTKQINRPRAGHKRDEVTGCVQSVTLPSAGITFPEDKNTVLLRGLCPVAEKRGFS